MSEAMIPQTKGEPAICPEGHLHKLSKDAAGFDTYGFLRKMDGYPCKWNRFRIRT